MANRNSFKTSHHSFKCIFMLSYEQLKEDYNTKNLGCGTGYLGKLIVSGKMQNKPFRTKYENFKFGTFYTKNFDGDFIPFNNGKTSKLIDSGEKTEFVDQYLPERIVNLRCNNYSCKSCRPILMNKLHDNIQRESYIWDINKHLIITFPGKPYRNKVSYDKSYKIMNYEFNKLIHRVYYEIEKLKEGKLTRSKQPLLKDDKKLPDLPFSYIVLPRAQANPTENNPIGFCHLHNLVNYPLNNKWIYEKVNKNNYKFGWNFIRENQSVADYLCKDFYDDDEWVIPSGIKHYRSSRNIKINMEYEKDNNLVYVPSRTDPSEVLRNSYTEYQIYGNRFTAKNSDILPFEEYLKEFSDIEDKLGDKETVMTGKGIQYKYRTKNGMFIKNMGYS